MKFTFRKLGKKYRVKGQFELDGCVVYEMPSAIAKYGIEISSSKVIYAKFLSLL